MILSELEKRNGMPSTIDSREIWGDSEWTIAFQFCSDAHDWHKGHYTHLSKLQNEENWTDPNGADFSTSALMKKEYT